ncbi:MAG: four-carbon acid sugar kinase family protein [Rhodobacteraceae bacterium]|nr:four-carbon acid sugar kinase family protein [Paracoccaceae bacterium]
MCRMVLIADDLTGALDAAAPFCGAGRRVAVATRLDALPAALAERAQVTAVSTRSREVPPEVAAARVREVVAAVGADRPIFKKIDSRLKGPIAAELSALPDRPLLVAPAIPAFGRVVADGAVQGFGVARPIPVAPRLGTAAARAAIPETPDEAAMDAALAAAPAAAILVGARGLAQAMARQARLTAAVPDPLSGRIAVAVGSTDPITLAQLARLERTPCLAAPSGSYAGPIPEAASLVMQAVPGPEADGATIARNLARSFRPLAERSDALILTGGATAEAVLDALDVTLLTLEGEILPGLPLSRAGGWRIVTKSGGFGDPGTLAELVEGQGALAG